MFVVEILCEVRAMSLKELKDTENRVLRIDWLRPLENEKWARLRMSSVKDFFRQAAVMKC